MWDELLAGPNERTEFREMYEGMWLSSGFAMEAVTGDLMFTDELTEGLLTVHEQHVQKLKKEWNTKASLLEGVHKYVRLLEDETTLVVRRNLVSFWPRSPCTANWIRLGNVKRSGSSVRQGRNTSEGRKATKAH